MNYLFSKKFLFTLYRFLYELVLCLITWVIPRSGRITLFAPFYNDNVNGNLWPLYRYINKYHPEMKTIIVAKERSFYLHLKKQGFPVVLSGSRSCFLAAVRASYLLVDHNTGTVFWWGIFQALANLSVIQVWHGTGFKQIVLMDEKDRPVGLLGKLRHYDKMIRCKKYDCIIASSEEDMNRKKESFLNNKVCITGYPKNDILFAERYPEAESSYRTSGLYRQIILYAPTFRDRGCFTPFTEKYWAQLEEELIKDESLFLIKKHPQDQLFDVPRGYDRIKDISYDVPDLQKLLLEIDLLVTDYSNIAVDFVLTGKPVVFYIFDYHSYVKTCRSFYYDLLQTLPGPFVYEQEELLGYVQDQAWFFMDEYQDRYASFRDRFHYYQDGDSSRRVMEKCIHL